MYYAMRKELKELEKQLQDINAEIKKTTKEMGESESRDSILLENTEFQELRYRVMYVLPQKYRDAKAVLDNIIIIDDTEEYLNFDGITVIRGAKVRFFFEDEEREETLEILGSKAKYKKNQCVSCDAPLIKVMLGRKQGEIVEFNGRRVHIKEVMQADQ